MYHSNQVREYKITNKGIKLIDVYLGPSGMLTGSARITQIENEKAEKLTRQHEIERKQRELKQKHNIMESKISEIKAHYESEKLELDKIIAQEKLKEDTIENERKIMAKIRHSNGDK